ncbi:hypothetical protein [Glutamicibacter protophormiae]|uniref:hypothetical protein n=1 Tax=Glutamicibacter protophormiae TaxID=37930 RepID=UPI003A93285E
MASTNNLIEQLQKAYINPALGRSDWMQEASEAYLDAWEPSERIDPSTGQNWIGLRTRWSEIPEPLLSKLVAYAPTYWGKVTAELDAEAARAAEAKLNPAARKLAILEDSIRAGAKTDPVLLAKTRAEADAERHAAKLAADGAKQRQADAKARAKAKSEVLEQARSMLPTMPDLETQIEAAKSAIDQVRQTAAAFDIELRAVGTIMANAGMPPYKKFGDATDPEYDADNTFTAEGVIIDGVSHPARQRMLMEDLALYALAGHAIPKNRRSGW